MDSLREELAAEAKWKRDGEATTPDLAVMVANDRAEIQRPKGEVSKLHGEVDGKCLSAFARCCRTPSGISDDVMCPMQLSTRSLGRK